MNTSFFYMELGFERLINCSKIASAHPEYRELGKIGADKVYFSGDCPVILFKEIPFFYEQTLREVAEIQRKVWNYRKVMFLYVMTYTEIRIYNCYEKPKYLMPDDNVYEELTTYEIFKTQKTDKEGKAMLTELFSQTGVDSGLLWTKPDICQKINLQRRIDRFLTQCLAKTADILGRDIKNTETVHALLIRSLLILHLEDRGAADAALLYSRIKSGAESYFDILDDADASYRLFDELYSHFNLSIFPVTDDERQTVTAAHLQTVKSCFTSGDAAVSPQLYGNWRIFDFSLIQTETLSEAYGSFIGELKDKNDKGQFHTPFSLVELMLNDRLPVKNETNHSVKVIDTSCNSGIFLVESYRRLIQRRKNASPRSEISYTELKDILLGNIFGIDADPLAIKITAFFLTLTLIGQLDCQTLWISKEYRMPCLTGYHDDDVLRNSREANLQCKDIFGDTDAETLPAFTGKADLLIGNPPSGTDHISSAIRNYLNKRKYAQEKVLAFMDQATRFVNNEGTVALIFNAKILTNTNKSYRNFRKWLFNSTCVERIYNFSIFRKTKKDNVGQLFIPTAIPVCIAYYKKTLPNSVPSTVEYYAPQTCVQSNLIDSLVIDSAEIKFLPRHECQKPDTKIWKIAMWGNVHDFRLFLLLNDKASTNLKTCLKQDKWRHATGLNGDSKHKDFAPDAILETKEICRYYTSGSAATPNEKYYRKIDRRLFQPPFIAVKKGQKDGRQATQVTASYIDSPAYCKSGVFIINKDGDDTRDMKKSLVAFFNSDLATYCLFLSTSSWGIERDQIMLNEYLELPAFFRSTDDLSAIAKLFDELADELKQKLPDPDFILQKETEINRTLEKIVGLTEKDQILIQDTLKFSLSLLEQGENSVGFSRTSRKENEAYARMIGSELNEILQHSPGKVNIAIYDVRDTDPLNMVALSFGTAAKSAAFKNRQDFARTLKMLNSRSLQQKEPNLYIRKHCRCYDGNIIYLVKPNQKRFWTRSQA
ncbi:MAG: N-6 DNA methylase, partial [Prevotellaceae bacterium]|nr:N-6 DNA methylase [Prevotellaceae bacterium]